MLLHYTLTLHSLASVIFLNKEDIIINTILSFTSPHPGSRRSLLDRGRMAPCRRVRQVMFSALSGNFQDSVWKKTPKILDINPPQKITHSVNSSIMLSGMFFRHSQNNYWNLNLSGQLLQLSLKTTCVPFFFLVIFPEMMACSSHIIYFCPVECGSQEMFQEPQADIQVHHWFHSRHI